MRHRLMDPETNECGVAVTAMLAVVDVETARRKIGKRFPSQCVGTSEIVRALKAFGVEVSSNKRLLPNDLTFCRRSALEKRLAGTVRRDAFLVLKRRDHERGMFHWVAWDARKGKILDPLGSNDKRPARVTSYREVIFRKHGLRSPPRLRKSGAGS